MIGELETARRIGLPLTQIILNNAAPGYVKALQHLMFGEGSLQSSELVEMNYAEIARAMGCEGIRITDPNELSGALAECIAKKDGPVVLDVVVTRNPAQMLPSVDNRVLKTKAGDRLV